MIELLSTITTATLFGAALMLFWFNSPTLAIVLSVVGALFHATSVAWNPS